MDKATKYKSLKEGPLREYCTELGLDPEGPVPTLHDRIHRHLNLSNNNKEKFVKKRRKKAKREESNQVVHDTAQPAVEVEVVPETLEIDSESSLSQFSQVFSNFTYRSQRKIVDETVTAAPVAEVQDSSDSEDYEEKLASKKKMRKINRISVAVLKQVVKRPDTVDWVDVTAPDPFLLVAVKAVRNTVPVPLHWSQKRKFLQGKRGAEKIPYELPEYIQDTGIMQLREATATGNRNKYQAKMGRLDIDYQKLHDAFFKYQTKPHFSMHGILD
jgi:splicing factor 3B subunit 2